MNLMALKYLRYIHFRSEIARQDSCCLILLHVDWQNAASGISQEATDFSSNVSARACNKDHALVTFS